MDEKQQKYFDKNFQKFDWASSSAIQIFALVLPHKFYRKIIFSSHSIPVWPDLVIFCHLKPVANYSEGNVQNFAKLLLL